MGSAQDLHAVGAEIDISFAEGAAHAAAKYIREPRAAVRANWGEIISFFTFDHLQPP